MNDHSQQLRDQHRSAWRAVAAACIVVTGFCFVAGAYVLGLTDQNAAQRDFIGYWAAGQQLAHNLNPYDSAAILRIELAKGLNDNRPRVTPSPPVALLLFLPLGFFGAKAGLILWLLVQLASLSLAIWILWLLHGRPQSRWHLCGYLFAPALACLMAGQLGIFFLLSVVLFLYLHKLNPFWAGAALSPCTLKPHLFLPFALALVIWVVGRRAYRIVAGFLAFLIVNCAIAQLFDHEIWSQYWQMITASEIQDRFTPTISLAFRALFDSHPVWVQYLPEAAACVWTLWYFWSRPKRWEWLDQGMLVLLVSVACAPYAWFTDEAVLLPALLTAIYRAVEIRRSLMPILLLGGVALLETLATIPITTWFFVWTAPAWLGWYLYATQSTGKKTKEPNSATDEVPVAQ